MLACLSGVQIALIHEIKNSKKSCDTALLRTCMNPFCPTLDKISKSPLVQFFSWPNVKSNFLCKIYLTVKFMFCFQRRGDKQPQKCFQKYFEYLVCIFWALYVHDRTYDPSMVIILSHPTQCSSTLWQCSSACNVGWSRILLLMFGKTGLNYMWHETVQSWVHFLYFIVFLT